MSAEAYIEKVAIVGAGGNIGSHFTRELLQTGKHTVTAITRAGSSSWLPIGVRRVEVDYDEFETLVDALRGQQFLIITLSIYSPPGLHSMIVKAASAAGVPYVMPNVYANDLADESLCNEDLYGAAALDRCAEIQQQGNTAYVAMICGFWYEWSLAMGEQWFGFDLAKKSVTFFDDGMTPITTSSAPQCGRAVAALLSQPEATVAQWKNGLFYIASFTVSQRDMLDSVHRVMGTTDGDWTIKYEPCHRRYTDGLGEMQNGIRTGYAKAMYTRAFFKNGGGDFESRIELANGTIGLSKEELDDATRRALVNGLLRY